jgi:hypothetical protein
MYGMYGSITLQLNKGWARMIQMTRMAWMGPVFRPLYADKTRETA